MSQTVFEATIDRALGTVTVVIAVHNAPAELHACLDSVIAHTPAECRVLAIDDASTDERVWPLLQRYAIEHPRVRIVSHAENRGYTATINEGCRVAEGDVILLNSDTRVTPGWVERLVDVAYSRPRVATVTPLSNAAGAFSVPGQNVNAELPEEVTAEDMAALVERLSDKRRPEVPTGNGYCMYVTRHALDAIGLFDEQSFPRGYGEENDFCMRALEAGFVNLIDDATFIYHRRSASFGESKARIVEQATARLRELHPEYKPLVNRFLANDHLGALRQRLEVAIEAGAEVPGRGTVLYVVHAGGGGTPLTTADLVRSVSNEFRCLVLTCDLDRWTLLAHQQDFQYAVLEELRFPNPYRATEELDAGRAGELERICSEYRVDVAHVRSIVGSGPELLRQFKEAGVPVVYSFHDFSSLCPTINLLDEDEMFCGGHCTPGGGACTVSRKWFRDLPELKHGYVYDWRGRMGENLDLCDAFVTTSRTARAKLFEHFPLLDDGRLRLIEHGRDYGRPTPVAVPPHPQRPRVVTFGALGMAKGIRMIARLMEIDREEGGFFEWHFLGAYDSTRFDPVALGGVHHGSYQRETLRERLAAIQPSYALVSSITMETYCHTLTECWAFGLPPFVSDIGTLRERVLRHGGAWLVDYRDAHAWYREMRRVAETPGEWERIRTEMNGIHFRTVDEMGLEFRTLYREVARLPEPSLVTASHAQEAR